MCWIELRGTHNLKAAHRAEQITNVLAPPLTNFAATHFALSWLHLTDWKILSYWESVVRHRSPSPRCRLRVFFLYCAFAQQKLLGPVRTTEVSGSDEPSVIVEMYT